MQTEGAIRHKLKQVRFRYLKRRLETGLAASPGNCAHNVGFSTPGHEDIRVCGHGMGQPGWQGSICDERFGGCARAETCSLFQSRQSKDEIKDAFYAELSGMSLPEIAYNFPDMAALLWVLAPEAAGPVDSNEFDGLHQSVDVDLKDRYWLAPQAPYSVVDATPLTPAMVDERPCFVAAYWPLYGG